MKNRKYQKKTQTKSEDWKKKLEAATGVNVSKTEFANWTWEKMEYIFRKAWWDVLKYAKDNDLTLRNIVAITGKDTRKTTVWLIFLWFLMVQYPFLNGYILRDTIKNATKQMKQQLRKAVSIITDEYEVKKFNKKAGEASDGFYLVRNNKSKGNQKIELMSFQAIVELGGFTTNNGQMAIFIYDELQNPDSSKKEVLEPNQFMARYKLVAQKNHAIEMSTANSLPKWIPRHIFLSNRYVGNHALNIFAEEHFPFYDHQEDDQLTTGVKSWMLKDPLNNNFIGKYFAKEDMKKGWEDFWGTMIVYASKLSNEIFRMDKEWEQEQIDLIARGNEDDLAIIIGDLFEGYDNSDLCYHYTKKTKISEKEFIDNYAMHVDRVRISMDIDYNRQIVFGGAYDCVKQKDSPEHGKIKIWRTVRDKIVRIKCDGLTPNGAKTEMYLKYMYKGLLDYCLRIHQLMPHIKKVRIIMDDNSAGVPGRFNFAEYQNNFWAAVKVFFKKKWPIGVRPPMIDTMQDSGYVIDIDHPSLNELHDSYKTARMDKIKDQRLEKDGNALVDLWNLDEYRLYEAIGRMVFNNVSTKKLGGHNEW